jgi:phosphoketolase
LATWGTTPRLNFIYVHLNRIIKQYDLNMINVTGPGHGGPGLVANTYPEGTYSERYPDVSQDERDLKTLFTQFSFPGGIPSHVAAETPGSINEGGELGYSLMHAYGAAFDNPDLLVACVEGDGKAETGALATSWHSNKFLNPVHDGAVLPILHLNDYKIASPTVLARISRDELAALFRGYGYKPYIVEGDDPQTVHQLMAGALDHIVEEIRQIQSEARSQGFKQRPAWPMIILRTPKGWTGPAEVDGLKMEGSWRSYQVPLANLAENPKHPVMAEATRVTGTFLRDVMKLNLTARNFRVFGPDETAANRLTPVFEITDRAFTGEILESDAQLSPDGCQHLAVGDRSLFAPPAVRQRHRCGQAAGTAVAGHGRGRQALHRRARHLEMGQQ